MRRSPSRTSTPLDGCRVCGHDLYVICGKISVYGDCAFVLVLQHHLELERGLYANNKGHIVCCNRSVHHHVGVLVVEHKVRVFPHLHSHTLNVIRVLHI
jgi:hypothetical protein